MDAAGSINNDACVDSIENEEEPVDDSEERELVTDSCSTKVLDVSEEPRDRYRIVYFLFLLFGITSLVPWNFLITANDVSDSFLYQVVFRSGRINNLKVTHLNRSDLSSCIITKSNN